MADEPSSRRPPISQLSKTPSWVMLGFILGALVVWALPRREPPAPRPIVVAQPEPEKPPRASEPPLLTTVESLFEQWQQYAVWDHDVTQVALWDAARGEFDEFYEVRRVDNVFYFRSIPRITGRILRHGKLPPPECPLRFAESEEQYRDWRQEGRYERPSEQVRPSVTLPRPDVPKPAPVEVTPAPPPVEPPVKVAPAR